MSDTTADVPSLEVPSLSEGQVSVGQDDEDSLFAGPQYVVGGDTNLAYEQSAETVHPELTQHSKKMRKGVYQVTDNVYLALGYGLANSTMVVGDDGLIIIDVMESMVAGKDVMAAFREITDKPVKAVVLTHNHADHIFGFEAFASKADVAAGKVKVYAHETLAENVRNIFGIVAPIIGVRSFYTFGTLLGKGPQGSVNEGIGPLLNMGNFSYVSPTDVFRDRLDVTVSGIDMELHYVPSETNDEIVVWFPKMQLLQTAEVLQGESFPNLHAIRGSKFRNPYPWYKSIDVLRTFNAEIMVPSHGRAVVGQDKVEYVLRSYRDAIQFVHDQTIYHMNRGLTPDELVAVVNKLPAHLAGHPWLGEFYGTVKHSVRQMYVGYLGWFEGDPTALDPLPRVERAEKYVALMGGRDAVVAEAKKQLESNPQWAAELLTYVIRVDHDDADAKNIKAQALRALGYATKNINWRNWYLTSALELEGNLHYHDKVDQKAKVKQVMRVLKEFPMRAMLESMPVRLKGHEAVDAHLTLGIEFTDSGEKYALEIRRGIMQVHDDIPEFADMTVSMKRENFMDMAINKATLVKAVVIGDVKFHGSLADLQEFIGYLNDDLTYVPPLTVR